MSVLMTDKVSIRGPAHFIQGDTQTQIVWFTVNRYSDGVDLAQLAWSVHIKNADGQGDVAVPYEEPDVRGNKIIIGWMVRGIATAAVGDLTFNLRGVAEDSEGNPVRWSSGDEKRPVYASLETVPSDEQEEKLSQLDALIEYVGNQLPKLMEDVRKVPIIGENGNWWLWDFDLGKYVDSGKPARGEDGGYIIPSVKDVGGGYINFSFTPSDPSMDVIIMDRLIKLPEGPQGDDGPAGFSPTVSVTQIEGGNRVTITDANGSQSFDILDGSAGIAEESDPTVPAWAKEATKPSYTAAEVGAIADASGVLETKHYGNNSISSIKLADDAVWPRHISDLTWAEVDKRIDAAVENSGGGDGTVKTVNGIGPDENGNVELDISVEGSEVLDMLIELDALPAVTDADGAIYTDENGSILVM